MKLLSLLFVLSFAQSASAFDEAIFSRIAYENYQTHQAMTPDGVALNYIELLGNDGQPMTNGRPILLMHGFTSNLNSWKIVAEEYRRKGLRVFIANWRGHGQGPSRSIVKGESFNGRDARYEYDNMAIHDVPTLVKQIYKRCGQKVIYQGHSMGGMMAHLAFGGLTRNRKGEVVLSDAKARWLETMVAAFIPVGSPLELGSIGTLGELYLKVAGIRMDHSNSLSEYLIPNAIYEEIKMRATYEILRATDKMDGTINMKNMTFQEYAFMSKYGGSDVPTALIESLGRMGNSEYGSEDGKINYTDLSFRLFGHRTSIPTLVLSADGDSLALLARQTQFARENSVAQVVLRKTGHVDMVTGENRALRVVSHTLDFIRTLPLCEELLAQ